MSPAAAGLAGALVAAVVTAAGAPLARLLPLTDVPDDRTRARKHQATAVPCVGGAALLVAWIVQTSCSQASWAPSLPGVDPASTSLAARWGPWAAMVAAFTVGLVDDLRPGGLGALPKLCAQLAAGVVLAGALLGAGAASAWSAAVWVLLAVAAMNLVNTFDNADGAAAGLGLAGLAVATPAAAGALAGFLPFNLWLRRRGDARAYLGDSGSHLVGMVLLLEPAAWPVLLLPGLDLARVSLARLREGRPVWSADRLHLAHRLQAAGLAPTPVAALLVGIAFPALWPAGLAGAALVVALFGVAVGLSPAGGGGGGLEPVGARPCSRREAGG
ncbi:MAG: hypothetical protein QF903_13620 [Planctomycetota bacterium]|nr:hypothetical protein [Planctomycetota bacterium]MDP6762366.1 hypothetical protein [Planctomycetota bacterium]MDP6990503.1 hypothetical protein [Planctomycetota bacterium]